MDISIVIVSYNVAEYLDRCLESIRKEMRRQHEIIVVDNGSSDDSLLVVKAKHPRSIIIQNGQNRGFAAANNQGFQKASGKYVFLLNPDTLVLEGSVDKLADFMDWHPEIGISGPRNLNPDGSLQMNCHHFPTLTGVLWDYLQFRRYFPRSRIFGREHMTYWDYDDTREVDWITGSSLMIRKEILNELGGLDEGFFMYSEECDLCYRARKAGWMTAFIPEAAIIHFGGQSALAEKEFNLQDRMILEHFFQSRYYFFRKHYGRLREVGLKIITVIYYGISFIKNRILLRKKGRVERMKAARTIIRQSLAGRNP